MDANTNLNHIVEIADNAVQVATMVAGLVEMVKQRFFPDGPVAVEFDAELARLRAAAQASKDNIAAYRALRASEGATSVPVGEGPLD